MFKPFSLANAYTAGQSYQQNALATKLMEQQMKEKEMVRNKLAQLIGQKGGAYQMGEDELFPGEQPIPGLKARGSGYLGTGDINALYGGLLTVPGYEKVGLAGIKALTPGAGSKPSMVGEYEYWKSLPTDRAREEYLLVKRAQKYLDTGASYVAPSMINPTQASPVIDKELSPADRPENVAAKTRAKKEAELGTKKEFSKPKATAAAAALQSKAELLRNKLVEAEKLVGPMTTGAGAVLANLPATDARRLRGVINTVLANLGFNELQEMRANSPTGGALGQVSERELALLTSTKQALDQAQSSKDVLDALKMLEEQIDGMEQRVLDAYEQDFGDKLPRKVRPKSEPPQPTGASIDDLVNKYAN
jgi:hypothetical protein